MSKQGDDETTSKKKRKTSTSSFKTYFSEAARMSNEKPRDFDDIKQRRFRLIKHVAVIRVTSANVERHFSDLKTIMNVCTENISDKRLETRLLVRHNRKILNNELDAKLMKKIERKKAVENSNADSSQVTPARKLTFSSSTIIRRRKRKK